MIDSRQIPPESAEEDGGFTLIEVLIVITSIAIIAGAVAATISVVLRTAPPTEERANDARSLQGLVTWIPQDVDAAPPSGFDTAPTAWPCGGPAPTNSYNVLAINWTETTASITNYASTYRYEFDGTDWHIARYACDDVAGGAMSTGVRTNLTSALPPWDNLAPPASVTMCDTTVDNAGNCPAGHEILTNTSPDVRSLKIKITRIDGVESTIDAAPKNPDQDLADDPSATTNATPTLSQVNHVLDMFAGDTVTLDLNTTHNPTDADGDTLSVAIDSSEPMPSGITASTADPLDLTVTADPSLSTGTISPPNVLIISDPRAGWVDATETINIIPRPNTSPTLATTNYDIQLTPGEIVSLPIDVTHGATDADGDTLTVVPTTWPSSVVWNPTTGAPSAPMNLIIEAKSPVPPGPAPSPVTVLVSDGYGGTVSATVTIEFVAAVPVNNAPTVTTTNVDISMYAGDTIALSLDTSHGASDPDGDPISTYLEPAVPQPAGITTTLLGGLDIEITADPSMVDGLVGTPIDLSIDDPHGGHIHVTVTITIIPTPPPPSDCVLGTLTATPDPVSRNSNDATARLLKDDVTVTLTYTGSCDGLVLTYDTGDTSGLGVGTGRVFPPGSPSSIVIFSKFTGGTEKWAPGTHTLTASTTSAVTPSAVTTTLTVN